MFTARIRQETLDSRKRVEEEQDRQVKVNWLNTRLQFEESFLKKAKNSQAGIEAVVNGGSLLAQQLKSENTFVNNNIVLACDEATFFKQKNNRRMTQKSCVQAKLSSLGECK